MHTSTAPVATGAALATTPSSPIPRVVGEPPAALAFAGVLRSERIKLLSLRSIRATLVITAVCGLALSAMIALLWASELAPGDSGAYGAEDLRGYLLLVSTFAAPFLMLVFGVLGVFAVASEYSSGMILSSLAAVPRRGVLLTAKLAVTALIAAATALLITLGGLVIAVAVLPAAAAELAAPVVVTGALGNVLALVLIALLGFGIAALTRSTAGGIAVVAGLTFVLPIAFQVLLITGWEWVPTVAAYLPSNLGTALAQGSAAADPSFAVAALAMTAWAAAAIVPAAVALQRRDAK